MLRPKAPRRQTKPGRLAECLVLVADDNRDCADYLARLLRLMGCRVCTAYDGPEAVALAGKAKPDLVLMDVSLPTMSGYDAARIRRFGGRLGEERQAMGLAAIERGVEDSRHVRIPLRQRCREPVAGQRESAAKVVTISR